MLVMTHHYSAEVVSTNGGEVSRGTPLQDGRAAPRRIKDSSAETQRSEVSVGDNDQSRVKIDSKDPKKSESEPVKQPKIIDIHNHEVTTYLLVCAERTHRGKSVSLNK